MNRKIILYSLFLIFLCRFNRVLNADTLSNITNNQGYTTTLYNNNNGFPVSNAKAVTQASGGFIWIGDYGGLCRYDGNSFQRIGSENGIKSVTTLFSDSKNRFWIGTNNRGIALYKDGIFRFWGKARGLEAASVRKITEDGNGNILIGTTKGLAYIDSDMNLHILNDVRIATKYIRDLDSDGKGTVAGITLEGDIFVLQNLILKDYHSADSLDFPKARSIQFDKTGKIYFGMEQTGIVTVPSAKDLNSYTITATGTFHAVNKIYPTANKQLWLCTDNGIGYLDRNGKLTELKKIGMDNSVEDMMTDYEGNLWFASSRQGILKIVENRFNNITQKAELPKTVVNSTAKYRGKLYTGTDTGLFILDAQYHHINNNLTQLLDGIRIRCIEPDSSGNLWFCTFSKYGLVKYDAQGTIQTYTKKNGLSFERVRTALEMSNKDIVVAGDGGINVIRGSKVIAVYGSREGMLNTSILTVCEGENGIIYAGSDGGGLYSIDRGTLKSLPESNNLDSGVIMRIKKDPKLPVYWIVTDSSIAYLSGGKVHTVSSFPYCNNFDLYFSSKDRIWFLSGNGIYVVNRYELYKDQITKYRYYSVTSGIPSYATPNSKSWLDNDGMLYIAGTDGLFCTNLNYTDTNTTVRLTVPFVTVDGKIQYIKQNDKFVIPSKCQKFTIYGFALSYGLYDQKLEYRLDNFDKKNTVVTKAGLLPITYTNLPGKNYSFHLLALNPETGAVNNEISLPIVKTKKFIETKWFDFFVMVAAILVISGVSIAYAKRETKLLIQRHSENKLLTKQIISAFAKTIDCKDSYTNGHSIRVAQYTAIIAEKMGCKKEQVEQFYDIALLHDIGKIAIPDSILNKKERLTDEEFSVIKQHTLKGYDILSAISMFPDLAQGAKYHHERVDGTGYPVGLQGNEIPLVARIIAVADAFDAMCSTRIYREKLKADAVIKEIQRVSGTQLDSRIVDIAMQLINEGNLSSDLSERPGCNVYYKL